MSVTNNQPANQDTFNNAFVSKSADSSVTGQIDLNKPASGGNITNLQQTVNDKIDASEKGAVNGVAELDGAGKVPSAQLPSYVDDVLEFANFAAFPGTGETGKIYIAIDTGYTYRWSGSVYVTVSATEDGTMFYRGDWYPAGFQASFTGQVAGMTTDVTFRAVNPGTAGNSIVITGADDGFGSPLPITTLVTDWNTANPGNTVYLFSGNGAQTPNIGTTMQLSGGLAANSPTLQDGVGTVGEVYKTANAGGSVDFGSGSISFLVNDWVIYTENLVWEKVINTNAVESVNGQSGGAVVLTYSDVDAQNAIQFKDEGANIGNVGDNSVVNFTGAGVTASVAAGVVTVNIPGAGSSNLTVTAVKTANYTADGSDDVIPCDASGGSFTVTLPTAVGASGKVYRIKRTDQTLANSVTIATTGGQTIDGVTTRKLMTQNEEFTLASDNVGWLILDHLVESKWTDIGTNTITGSTSNPTKGTTSVDKIWGRRVGGDLEVRIEYVQSGTGANGSGDYLWALPSGYPIDTAKLTADTAIEGGGSAYTISNRMGSCSLGVSGNNGEGSVAVYDSSKVRFFVISTDASNNNSPGANGSTFYNFGTADFYATATFTVPITDWEG